MYNYSRRQKLGTNPEPYSALLIWTKRELTLTEKFCFPLLFFFLLVLPPPRRKKIGNLCPRIPIRFVQDTDRVPLRAGLKPRVPSGEVWPLVGHLFSSLWLSDPLTTTPLNTGWILSTTPLRLFRNRGICVTGGRKETEQRVGLLLAQGFACVQTKL